MQISSIPSILRRMRACILIIAACLSHSVTAADENDSTIAIENARPELELQESKPSIGDMSVQQEEPIEEITVTGQRIILSLRKQIIEAEDHAFEIFNELNDDDLYDITCRSVKRYNSNIKKRVCLPNYYHRATADNASEYLGLIGLYIDSVPSPSVKNVTAYQHPIFKKKVQKLATENPELLDALRVNFELNEELNKKRNAYHDVEED